MKSPLFEWPLLLCPGFLRQVVLAGQVRRRFCCVSDLMLGADFSGRIIGLAEKKAFSQAGAERSLQPIPSPFLAKHRPLFSSPTFVAQRSSIEPSTFRAYKRGPV